jgi:ATP-dependent RNA helicase DeaD
LEFDRFLQYYENAADLNVRGDDRRPERSSSPRGGERESSGGRRESSQRSSSYGGGSGYKKLFVNLGTKDGFYKASFLQFILDMSDLSKDVLGKIDMKEMNSWVEIDGAAANQMINAVDGKKFKGRKIRMNDADSGGPRNRF